MQVWRLLIGAASGLHHLVVSAPDHHEAWRVALAALGPAGEGAVLEELENTGQRAPARRGLVCRLPARGQADWEWRPEEPEARTRPCPWSGGGAREPARRRGRAARARKSP